MLRTRESVKSSERGCKRAPAAFALGVAAVTVALTASACPGQAVGAADNSVWPVRACELYPLQNAPNAQPVPLSETAFAHALGTASPLPSGTKVELTYITKEAQRAAAREMFVDMDGAMTNVQGVVEANKAGTEFVKLDKPLPPINTIAWTGYYDPYSVGRLHFQGVPARGAGVAFSTGCMISQSEISLHIASTVPPKPPAS